MRNNQIINSSIIINIIVNGKNETVDKATTEETTEQWNAQTEATTFADIDPGFWMHVQKQPEPQYQQPDFGLLKINDRHERPYIQEETTEAPE
jgi:hypothetical protein